MKRLFCIILILALTFTAYAIPPSPPSSGTGTVDVSGTPTNHQWPGWVDADTMKGFTVTASKVVCSDGSADPVACTNLTDTAIPTAASLHMDDILTALGISSEAVHFGTFTGSTIADNQTGKAAIQALETAVEGKLAADGLGSVTQAYSDILAGLAGVTPANNGIFGYNNSGTLGLYTNHSHDDSAAQFYSATASKGTFKMLMTSMGDGIAGSFTPVCTGACDITTESYGAGTYTMVDKTSTQTLTNKTLTSPTLTTPIITSLEVLIDCNGEADPYAYCTGANASTLTATQTSRTIINSYGRGEAQTVTLPAAATGMTFIAMVGTQHNSAWKIQRAGSDTITWSASGTDTAGKTYFQETNQAVGSRVSCITYKTGASAWTWLCGSVTGTWVTD